MYLLSLIKKLHKKRNRVAYSQNWFKFANLCDNCGSFFSLRGCWNSISDILDGTLKLTAAGGLSLEV